MHRPGQLHATKQARLEDDGHPKQTRFGNPFAREIVKKTISKRRFAFRGSRGKLKKRKGNGE